jgi:hypothetical protein
MLALLLVLVLALVGLECRRVWPMLRLAVH